MTRKVVGKCCLGTFTRENRLETFEPPQTTLEKRAMGHQGESRRCHPAARPWWPFAMANEFSLTTEFRSKGDSVVCHQKLKFWSFILGRLCIAVFPTPGGMGGTEELLDRAGVAL